VSRCADTQANIETMSIKVIAARVMLALLIQCLIIGVSSTITLGYRPGLRLAQMLFVYVIGPTIAFSVMLPGFWRSIRLIVLFVFAYLPIMMALTMYAGLWIAGVVYGNSL
jgi:hypothetical protein